MYRNAPSSSEINIRPSALNITALQVSLQKGQNKTCEGFDGFQPLEITTCHITSHLLQCHMTSELLPHDATDIC